MTKLNCIQTIQFWEELQNPENVLLEGVDPEQFWSDKNTSEIFFTSQLQYSDLKPEMVMLDLGCGLGRIARKASQYVKEYHGVDCAENLLQIAREKHKDLKNVFFKKNSGIDLKDYPKNSFDFVMCQLFFQHLNKELALSYIKEIKRVLKPNGIIYAQIPRDDIYVGGFTKEELIKEFANYDLKIQTTSHYHNIVAM